MPDVMTVSYTHLDVYKRQGQWQIHQWKRDRRSQLSLGAGLRVISVYCWCPDSLLGLVG